MLVVCALCCDSVLILVLMEDTLEVNFILMENLYPKVQRVLILVLMEDTLEEIETDYQSTKILSFWVLILILMEDTLEGAMVETRIKGSGILDVVLILVLMEDTLEGQIFSNLLTIRLLLRIIMCLNAVVCSKSVKYFNISLLLRYKILTRVTRIYLGKSSPMMDEKSGLGRYLTSKS